MPDTPYMDTPGTELMHMRACLIAHYPSWVYYLGFTFLVKRLRVLLMIEATHGIVPKQMYAFTVKKLDNFKRFTNFIC